mmetsp:Transcript_119901/g.334521  ORF Transcript_119901/g.334521 Transcript_119901/m.334521 type:complete len:273 (-) Transcript_119901:533-1351(-)
MPHPLLSTTLHRAPAFNTPASSAPAAPFWCRRGSRPSGDAAGGEVISRVGMRRDEGCLVGCWAPTSTAMSSGPWPESLRGCWQASGLSSTAVPSNSLSLGITPADNTASATRSPVRHSLVQLACELSFCSSCRTTSPPLALSTAKCSRTRPPTASSSTANTVFCSASSTSMPMKRSSRILHTGLATSLATMLANDCLLGSAEWSSSNAATSVCPVATASKSGVSPELSVMLGSLACAKSCMTSDRFWLCTAMKRGAVSGSSTESPALITMAC